MAIQTTATVIMSPLNGQVGGATSKGIAIGVPTQVAAQGRTVTNPVYLAPGTFGEFDVNLQQTNTPVVTAMPAGSIQLEISNDGNGFAPVPAAASNVPQVSAPVAVTAAVEGQYVMPYANKAWAYAKLRYILTGGVTLTAIQAAATSTPASAVQAMDMTADELFIAVATSTAAGCNITAWAQTTTPMTATSATVNGNLLVGTTIQPMGINFFKAIPIGAATNNQYYVAAAGGTSPFFSVAPISSAGVMGVVQQPAVGAITVGKCAAWWTGQPVAGTTFVGFCGTTTPFVQIYAYNVLNSTLGPIQVLGVTPAVGNATFMEFSPDGNYLLLVGATAPFAVIHPVTVQTNAQGVTTLTLSAAITKPATAVNSAPLVCRWHPTMERVAIANATTVVEYAIYRQSNVVAGSSLAWGPVIPTTSVNTGVLGCRYTPDGSHILIPDTLAGKMFQAFPIKDMVTAWGTVHTGPTVATGITQGNDAFVTPNGQYLVVGGAGGAIFLQTSPWNICVQMTVTITAQSAT